MAKGGHGKRKADGIPHLAQIAEGCRSFSVRPSIAVFAVATALRYFVSENPRMRQALRQTGMYLYSFS